MSHNLDFNFPSPHFLTNTTFIDWNGDFTGSDYPKEYTTTDAAEFQKYIGTYEDSQPGMPLFFQIEDGTVKIILEKQIA